MAISALSINTPSTTPVAQVVTTPPVADKAKSSLDTPPSTIVTLSAEAQRLSQSRNNSETEAQNGANANSVPKEANEAPGIQFMEGSTRAGRISTYA